MSYNLKLFFTFVLFGIFLALFTVYSFSKITFENELDTKLAQTQELLLQKEMKISNYIYKLDKLIFSISHNAIFKTYTKDGSNKVHVYSLLKTLSVLDKSILKVSYIDKDSNKLIEVDTTKNLTINNNVKRKVKSFSFKKIREQNIGDIWHSTFGLNFQTNGIGKNEDAIFITGLNLKDGILCLTVSLKHILKTIENEYYKILLVDKDGKIIIDSQKKDSWSKYLQKEVDLKKILNEENYDFLQKDFVKRDNFISKKLNINNDDKSVLILVYPDFGTMIDEKIYYMYIAILVATILLAIFLAYLLSKPMSKMTDKIERLNNKLDKKVEERTKKLKDSLSVIDKYVVRSVTDTDGVILSVSDAFCQVSQYTKEELIGKTHSMVRHPDMENNLFKDMWETIKSGKNWNGKIKNLAKDGSYYWVKAHIEPNFVDNKIVSFTAIRTKISNKVKLEELNKSLEERIEKEVQKSTEQLKLIQDEQLKSVKLNSIGTLAAGITHEINTPLTYIKGNFELMKYDLEDLPISKVRDRILEDAQVIEDGLQRISYIVDAMKEVSHSTTESVESINIYTTLVTALTLSFSHAKQVSKIYINNELFDIDFDKNKFEFNALVQKQRIEQVWIIIINNALDELVKIGDYETRNLFINIKKDDDKIIVDFIDNAGGIEEKMIEKIFEPFISTKERGGMGIGLNVAKNIINEHSGTITAKNINNGAKFTIELYAEGAKC